MAWAGRLRGVCREAGRAVRQGGLTGAVNVQEDLQVNVAVAVTVPRPGPDAQGTWSPQQRPGLDPPLLARQLGPPSSAASGSAAARPQQPEGQSRYQAERQIALVKGSARRGELADAIAGGTEEEADRYRAGQQISRWQ